MILSINSTAKNDLIQQCTIQHTLQMMVSNLKIEEKFIGIITYYDFRFFTHIPIELQNPKVAD